jgi:hypothetical protein
MHRYLFYLLIFTVVIIGRGISQLFIYSLEAETYRLLGQITILAAALPDIFGMPFLHNKIYTKNAYAYMHHVYGLKRMTAIKIYLNLVLFILTFSIYYVAGRSYLYTFVYFCIVVFLYLHGIWPGLFRDSFTPIKSQNNLDSLAGLLVYPFNSLRADVSLYDHRSQPLKWSWKAFLLPEAWFFYREIVGAGYAALLMLALCFLVYRTAGPGPGLALFVLVRVAFGLYAHKLYYARYGKLP